MLASSTSYSASCSPVAALTVRMCRPGTWPNVPCSLEAVITMRWTAGSTRSVSISSQSATRRSPSRTWSSRRTAPDACAGWL